LIALTDFDETNTINHYILNHKLYQTSLLVEPPCTFEILAVIPFIDKDLVKNISKRFINAA
jgi:hypothetical protein